MKPIFERVENRIPREIDQSANYVEAGKDAVGPVLAKYKIWRDPVKLSMNGNRLTLSAHAYYWIEAAQQIHKPRPFKGDITQKLGSCGENEPPREVQIAFTTEVNWGADWNLVSKTIVSDVQFPNRCSMTALNLDVTDTIKRRLIEKMNVAAAMIDARIRAANLKDRIQSGWNQLQKPIVAGADGKWLSVTPTDAAVGPITGSGDTLSTSASVTAFATLLWSGPPHDSDIQLTPLPPLRIANSAGGIHVAVSAVIPFETASGQLAKLLVGHKYKLASKEIEITGAAVYGSGDTAVLKLALAGGMTGTVYIKGKLKFDSATNMLSVQDINFSADSDDPMTKSFIKLMNDSPAFRNRIASAAQWPLGTQVGDARSQIDRTLNSPLGQVAHMKGSVTNLTLRGIEAGSEQGKIPGLPAGVSTKDAFIIQLTADGAAELDIDQ